MARLLKKAAATGRAESTVLNELRKPVVSSSGMTSLVVKIGAHPAAEHGGSTPDE
jgi:hypothetical protein